ncbi:lipopolysaccharide biosynthesis protein [Arsenicibacter rosenii]|uniref:Polysaccharide biosynthesis protein C-terminal domain-containing protein n=1 Tax=Arsenicibacter rosenii TaxID=1750698 RepID=A0A1S2VJ75_9BACT|nr:hypothetical protein [Arsenicibacter rosenii]OIN58799.1 hypothetical protein BLX24_11220 [Arsenicibacter rosenii]
MISKNKINNFFKNGVATAIQKIIKVAEQLVLVPFFISSWGTEYYGEWLTLTIIPNIFSLTDLGFGTAASNYFVLNFLKGDKKKAADISKSAFILITIILIIGISLSLLVVLILKKYSFLSVSIINENQALASVWILIVSRLISFYTQMFEAYYRAARKAALSINLFTIQSFMIIILNAIVLYLNMNIVYLALFNLVGTLMFVITYGVIAKRLINFKHQKIYGTINKNEIKVIGKQGFGYLLSPIWQAIFFQGSTLVVRITLGPESVTIFNTVRSLTRSVNQIINMIDTIVFPELQYEIGRGDLKKASNIYVNSVIITTIIALAGICFLLIFGIDIYKLWTGNSIKIDKYVWSVIVIGILFNALWWIGGVVFRAYNKPYMYTIAGVICSIISIILSYLLAQHIGLLGIAVGTLSLEVLMSIYVLPKSLNLLRITYTVFIDRIWNFLKMDKVITTKI